LVELFGRYSFDKLAMGLKLNRQFPCRAPPTTSQVTKRGIADLALHNLLAIPHRELERHQVGIIPNGLGSRQRHEPGSFSPLKRTAMWGRQRRKMANGPNVNDFGDRRFTGNLPVSWSPARLLLRPIICSLEKA
jgi:hypothetical protein